MAAGVLQQGGEHFVGALRVAEHRGAGCDIEADDGSLGSFVDDDRNQDVKEGEVAPAAVPFLAEQAAGPIQFGLKRSGQVRPLLLAERDVPV